MPAILSDQIRAKALSLGFDAVGIAPAELGPETRKRLVQFLSDGFHGTMGWIAERVEERSQPVELWPDVRSVICLGVNYTPAESPLGNLSKPLVGNVSVYARRRDYHDVVKGMLKHLAQYIVSRADADVKVFVDTAPVMEKALAANAKLGWQGKHTNLVSRRYGSWLFLGEIYTDIDIEFDGASTNLCGSCSRCLSVCPTSAFPSSYRLDATRCISYLTIEHDGPIPEPLRPLMGNRIYGCDDCLAVCPWNRFAVTSANLRIKARDDLSAPLLLELAKLDHPKFRQRFAGSPVKRIGRDRFIRNVAIAIGNSGSHDLIPTVIGLSSDSSAVVADAACWAYKRLSKWAA